MLLAAVLALFGSLYMPAVQSMAVRRLSQIAGDALGGELSVGTLRLRFPLKLSAENIALLSPYNPSDTVIFCAAVRADVEPWPLLRGRIFIPRAALHSVRVALPDSAAWRLDARLKSLDVGALRSDFSLHDITLHTITVDTLQLVYLHPSVDVHAALPSGRAAGCRLRLDNNSVAVRDVRLVGGNYNVVTRETAEDRAADDSTDVPWRINLDALAIEDNSISYTEAGSRPMRGFDFRNLAVAGLNIEADSLYNRGAEVALILKDLRLRERSGVVVTDAAGVFRMNADTLLLGDFVLRTIGSTLRATVNADGDILQSLPASRFSAELSASLDGDDIAAFLPSQLPAELRRRSLALRLRADGTLDAMTVSRLHAEVAALAVVDISGRAVHLTTPQRRFDAEFNGHLYSITDVGEVLQFQSLDRLAVAAMELHGTFNYGRERMAGDLEVVAEGGNLGFTGMFEPSAEHLTAALRTENFPVGAFLPRDSLGLLSGSVDVRIAGFTPQTSVAEVEAAVRRLDFRGRDFGGIELRAALRDGRLEGILNDTDSALNLRLGFSGEFDDILRRAHISGGVKRLDIAALGLAGHPAAGRFTLQADGEIDSTYRSVRVMLDSIDLHAGFYSGRVQPLTARLRSDTTRLTAEMTNGDLTVRLLAPMLLDSLMTEFSRGAATISRQLRNHDIDMAVIADSMPRFTLDLSAGRRNILADMARRRDISFARLKLTVRNDNTAPLAVHSVVEEVKAGGMALDSMTFGITSEQQRLNADLQLFTAVRNFRGSLRGEMFADSVAVVLRQENPVGTDRFRFGASGLWRDSMVRISMSPRDPVFDARSWQANAGNFVEYRAGLFTADLDLRHNERRLSLHSDGETADLKIAGVDIGTVMALMPEPPQLEATLGADATLRMVADSLTADVRISVDSLRYTAPQLTVTGAVDAAVRARGKMSAPQLDGGIRADGVALHVPVIGTTFTLSQDTIQLTNNRLQMSSYAVSAPAGSRPVLAGGIDFSDFASPMLDVAATARDFEVVDTPRRMGGDIHGNVAIDLDAMVQGPLARPVIRGGATLLSSTDITYTLPATTASLRERSNDVVRFVSFSDLKQSDIVPVRSDNIDGMDMLVTLDIERDARAAVNLSADGANRAEVQGGGLLTYSLNPFGDSNFSGRYTLSGGSISYAPPLVAGRTFTVTDGSYVEWIGDISDPRFDITAVERIRTSVVMEDADTHSVIFEVSIVISNSLNELNVVFNLAAPEDLTLQNQLSSMTAEQRAAQAMSLLLYNTYTGPGTTARATVENPINSFIERELNQWANNIRGVDLSFGIDTYGAEEPTGERTDYSYRLSKNLFGNRVRAVVGGRIATDSDPTENLRDNFLSDISIEYLVNRSGNIYLRLFRHSDYESILEGEVVETGVGFVVRKRLSRLGDLFRKTDHEKNIK